jgi:hypothetical protein
MMTTDYGYQAAAPAAGRRGADVLGAVALGVGALRVLAGIGFSVSLPALIGALGGAGYSALSSVVGVVLALAAFVLGLVAVIVARRRGSRGLLGWAGLGIGALGIVQALGSLVAIPLAYLG